MIRFEVCNCLDSRYSVRGRGRGRGQHCQSYNSSGGCHSQVMDKSGMDDECLRSIQESSSLAELVQTILEDCKVS